MRAAGISSFGRPIELVNVADPPSPTADEVVPEVRSAGVGNWDQVVRGGSWDVGRAPPLVRGVEAAGVVLTCGPEVPTVRVGDAVLRHPLPLLDQGCWAERMLVRASLLALKPTSMDWAGAAVFPGPAPPCVRPPRAHDALAKAGKRESRSCSWFSVPHGRRSSPLRGSAKTVEALRVYPW